MCVNKCEPRSQCSKNSAAYIECLSAYLLIYPHGPS